jgi:putative ABC transport system ATP-binding protein
MPTLVLQQLQTRHLGPLDIRIEESNTSLSGPSGSGKTLLLRAIADLDPHEGEVLVDGQAQSATPPSQWRQRVAYVPAESHWWSDRVGDHFPSDAKCDFKAVGFGPDVLDWEVGRMSSGERQRLALVRALSGHPGVLLLDEPTANLDTENRERVERLIADYQQRQGALALWVTHDPEQRLRVAARQFEIRDGGIRELAPP